MLRHGMLSPNSKLLPQLEQDSTRLSILSSSSYLSNASNISLKSIASTSSKHPKDARDTPQRRVRHRDGRLLKGGIGLTTGLGWSDRSVPLLFFSRLHSRIPPPRRGGVWFARGTHLSGLHSAVLASGDGWDQRKRRAGWMHEAYMFG